MFKLVWDFSEIRPGKIDREHITNSPVSEPI
jgi:hypothetical protein